MSISCNKEYHNYLLRFQCHKCDRIIEMEIVRRCVHKSNKKGTTHIRLIVCRICKDIENGALLYFFCFPGMEDTWGVYSTKLSSAYIRNTDDP